MKRRTITKTENSIRYGPSSIIYFWNYWISLLWLCSLHFVYDRLFGEAGSSRNRKSKYNLSFNAAGQVSSPYLLWCLEVLRWNKSKPWKIVIAIVWRQKRSKGQLKMETGWQKYHFWGNVLYKSQLWFVRKNVGSWTRILGSVGAN